MSIVLYMSIDSPSHKVQMLTEHGKSIFKQSLRFNASSNKRNMILKRTNKSKGLTQAKSNDRMTLENIVTKYVYCYNKFIGLHMFMLIHVNVLCLFSIFSMTFRSAHCASMHPPIWWSNVLIW